MLKWLIKQIEMNNKDIIKLLFVCHYGFHMALMLLITNEKH